MPLVYQRVKNVREVRLASKAAPTRKLADIPTRFAQITQPKGVDFILIPCVSSERRNYIPIGFISREVKVTDAVQIVPNATPYHFGILTSSIHMTWLKTVGGRLKSDYRYSKDVVYNNFIWCEPSDKQRAAIEQTAQNILDVRKNYHDASFAELYDEISMPYELRAAHKKTTAQLPPLTVWKIFWTMNLPLPSRCLNFMLPTQNARLVCCSYSIFFYEIFSVQSSH